MGFFSKDKVEGMTLGEVSELLGWIRTPTSMVFTPTNLKEERQKFFDSKTYNPQFKYSIVKNSNDRILDTLKDVSQIVDVDPRLSEFYIELIKSKSQANDLMYSVGDNKAVTELSVARFRRPTHALFKNAGLVLREKVDGYKLLDYSKSLAGEYLHYEEIKQAFMTAFDELELQGWTVGESQNIKGSGLKVGIKSKEVFMDPGIKRKPLRLKKALVHELTHIARAYNGEATGYSAFSKPTLSNYLDVEEGLTGWNEEQLGLMTYRDLRNRAAKAWVAYIGEDLSFRELYDVCSAFVPKGLAWAMTYSAKRGLGDTSKPGLNTRDVTYFRGFRLVRRKLSEDNSLHTKLYAGKINFKQVRWVEEGLIKQPKIVLDKDLMEKVFKKIGI